MTQTLLAVGFFDGILLLMFLTVLCIVGGVVLLAKAAAAPDSRAQSLAGKAARGAGRKAAELALTRVLKGLRP